MILFYTASQDATIYLQQPYQNTGIDEVLEISKQLYGDTPDMSRVLIKFDTTEISKSVFELQNTKLQTISSSIYNNNLISSSWNSTLSSSLYWSASYSNSLLITSSLSSSYSASWNLAKISSSLFSASYNAASQSTLTIIQNGGYNFPFSASLQLKITKADEIPANFIIEAYPISQSWEMGTGTRFDNITTNGVTWYYRNGDDTTTIWNNTYVGGNSTFNPFTTGSQTGLGGTWYTSSVSTQSFQYSIEDINLDVTSFVKKWNSGSIPNNGIIIKIENDDNPTNHIDYGSIKIFSKETNTIYQPKLVITYLEDDIVSGSLTTITDFINSSSYDASYRCYSPNLKTAYHEGQKVTIKIDARELYPIKQFNTTFAYQVKYYLPSSAYYSVIDTLTKEPIINYSEASRVIQGEFNNLIKLNFSNWPVGRNYTLLVKSIDDHNEEIFEIGSFDIYK